MPTAPPVPPTRPPPSAGDAVFRALCQSAGLFVLCVAAGLVTVLVYQSWPVLSKLGTYQLLTSTTWDPDRKVFGALVFVYGTAATSAIAMLIAVPLGVGAAAYLSEIAPGPVRRACAFLLELLAAVPSVVYGFWGKAFLAPGVQAGFDVLGLTNVASGQGILSAGLILAVMVLPYITAVSYDVCQAVPRSQREGALALGATRWQTIRYVVLPHARPGVVAACFLALGRAVGETMAVTMLIGNTTRLSFSVAATGDSIPSVIAKELHEAIGVHRAALVALGLVLLVLTLLTNVTARLIIRWAARPRVRASRPRTAKPAEPGPAIDPDRAHRRAIRTDRLMTAVLAGCQVATVVPLFLILGYITYRGAAEVDVAFFTNLPVPMGETGGGLAHALAGSAVLVLLASAFAVPTGVLAAVLLAEYRASRLAAPVRFVAELLAGVPSIVVGVFGYAVLVYPFWLRQRWGFSAWAGAFALGVMMLPVVIRAAEEAMRLVPDALRQASYALGATRRQTVLRVIIPAALPAITTGALLAVGRIAGETAPLILTARGSNLWPRGPSDPTPSVPYYIYEYSKSGDPGQIRLAWAAAFVLLVVVLLLNVGTRLVAGRRGIAAGRGD